MKPLPMQLDRIIITKIQLHVSWKRRYLPVREKNGSDRERREGRPHHALLHFQLLSGQVYKIVWRQTGKISPTTWRLHFRYLPPISAHECASNDILSVPMKCERDEERSFVLWIIRFGRLFIEFWNFTVD